MKKLILAAALAATIACPIGARADFANYDAAVTAARAQAEAGDYAAARVANAAATKLATTPKQKFDTQLRDGQLDLAEKKPVTAREKMQRALQMATSAEQKIRAMLLIGQTYREEKNYASAIATWQQVLALPNLDAVSKGVAEIGIAGTYLDDEKFDLSRQWLSRIIADAQTNKTAKDMATFSYAMTYLNQKDEPRARVELAKIVANTDIDLSLRATAQNLLGESYFKAADYPTARAELAKVAALGAVGPGMLAAAQAQIIESYRRENNPQQAQSETARFQFEMMKNVVVLMNAKQIETAREYLRAVSAVDGSGAPTLMSLSAHSQIAQTYLAEKNTAQARKELAPILERDEAQIPDAERPAFRLIQQSAQLSFALSYELDGDLERSGEELKKLLQMPELRPELGIIAEKRLADLQ